MIYRANYLIPISSDPIEHGEVLVRDGRIIAAGVGLAAAHPEEPVADLADCALLPGFVNAHSHLDSTLRRNLADGLNLWDWLEAVAFRRGSVPEYATLLLSATLGAAECVLSGITCLGDSTISGAAAKAMADVGLRGIAYREVFGQSWGSGYQARFARALDEIAALQSELPERIRVGISPHSVYTSNREVLELCSQVDLPVALHLAETQAEVDYALHATGPIADMRRRMGQGPMLCGWTLPGYLCDVGLLRPGVCLAHCVHLSESGIYLIVSSGASVAHCPRSNAFLGCGIAPLAEMLQAGVRVGLGTDSEGSCMRFDFFEEMRAALWLARAARQDASALSAKDVLRIATLGGAEALGLDGSVGSIEPGKRADLIAVDLSETLPAEDIHLAVLSRSPENVSLVVVDGAEVARGGVVLNVDVAGCREALRERARDADVG